MVERLKIHIQSHLWCWKPKPIRFSELQQVNVNGLFRVAWRSKHLDAGYSPVPVVTTSFPHLSARSDHPPASPTLEKQVQEPAWREEEIWKSSLFQLEPSAVSPRRSSDFLRAWTHGAVADPPPGRILVRTPLQTMHAQPFVSKGCDAGWPSRKGQYRASHPFSHGHIPATKKGKMIGSN